MAKIGTAHIEIKPVINDEALDAISQRIEDAVAAGVARGMWEGQRRAPLPVIVRGTLKGWTASKPAPTNP